MRSSSKIAAQKTTNPDGRALVNRGVQPVMTISTAPLPGRALVNKTAMRPDTPLAATPIPKMII
jgi:hypothetical protein